jgi:hypothetical protein
LKKISYSLRIGVVGDIHYNTEVFLDSLKKLAIESSISKEIKEFFVIHKDIPIKIKLFLTQDIDELIYNYSKIENLDVVILTINLFGSKSLYQYYKNLIEEFNETYYFQGISILVGVDIEQIFNKKRPKKYRISRFSLEDLAKYLNLIYCYEIHNKSQDVIEIYNKIFNDFLFRFRYSNPEVFEQTRIYGKNLVKDFKA